MEQTALRCDIGTGNVEFHARYKSFSKLPQKK